jgi:hypothetical protein
VTQIIHGCRTQRVRLVLWIGAIGVSLAVTGLLIKRVYSEPPSQTVTYSGEADIRSEFSLTDHTGRAVTEADYLGRWCFLAILRAPIFAQQHSPIWAPFSICLRKTLRRSRRFL